MSDGSSAPVHDAVRRADFPGYSDEDVPLGAYAALSSVFAVAFGGGLAALRARGRPLPDRVSPADVVLVGIATHKLTRLMTKDRVTSFARAPFTRFEEPAGHGEVSEEPRGRGLRRAVGELVVCPYCVGQWVVGGLTLGMIGAPRLTRVLTGMYAAETVSDALQLAYVAGKQHV